MQCRSDGDGLTRAVEQAHGEASEGDPTVTSPSDIMPSALASEFLRAQDYYKVFSRFLMEGNREFWASVLAPQSVEGIHLSGPGCTCAGCKVRIRREAWINERTVPAERHDQVVRLLASSVTSSILALRALTSHGQRSLFLSELLRCTSTQ